MATSAPFSLSCISQSRLLSKPSPSPAASSLLSSQFGHKPICHPLRYSRVSVSPIGINPKRRINVGLSVRASLDDKNLEVFSKENLRVYLAKYISDLSNKFIKERGYFTIVLSGSSVKYLRNLVEDPYLKSIEWSKWHVFWADEKVVPRNHLDSNYKLAYDRFISKVPIPIPSNVNTIEDTQSADGAADVYESNIKLKIVNNVVASTANGLPKFDLVLLDTAADGHVAALFPGHSALEEKRKLVAAVKDAPQPPPQRITLTLPVINAASNIAMVVTGIGKAEVVRVALKGVQSGGEKLPVQLVSPEEGGELKWFLDKDAASKLYN